MKKNQLKYIFIPPISLLLMITIVQHRLRSITLQMYKTFPFPCVIEGFSIWIIRKTKKKESSERWFIERGSQNSHSNTQIQFSYLCLVLCLGSRSWSNHPIERPNKFSIRSMKKKNWHILDHLIIFYLHPLAITSYGKQEPIPTGFGLAGGVRPGQVTNLTYG